jgi:putative tryptophan/tyrosine transport system substrate-binding protein
MRRREFLTLLVGAAAARPLAAGAQQRAKVPTIGFLGAGTQPAWATYTGAFLERLRELGWINGRTVKIEYRWAEGRAERFAEIAAEFVRLKVSVIVTAESAAIEAKRATSTIPIVLALANDPLAGGLVASLARPGGNVTGLSLQAPEIASKRLGLLREIFPAARRLAILTDVGYPAAVKEMREVQTRAPSLGLDVITLEIRQAQDIAPAVESLTNRADALYVCADALISANQLSINQLVLAQHLAAISGVREYAKSGGLLSYGPDNADLFRQAAEYVDKILHGAKPSDLPVEQPTKFDLVVNRNTAEALGLIIPSTMLATADEVIE